MAVTRGGPGNVLTGSRNDGIWDKGLYLIVHGHSCNGTVRRHENSCSIGDVLRRIFPSGADIASTPRGPYDGTRLYNDQAGLSQVYLPWFYRIGRFDQKKPMSLFDFSDKNLTNG
jgi:hypothetical protein